MGRALDGTLRFRRWKRSRAFSRRCQRSLATCQAMHGDAVKARPGREKTKMVAAQGSNSSVSTLRIRFLPIGCFVSAFVHLLRTLPKEVGRSTATKVESGILDPNRRSLVRERRVKKDRMLVGKIQIEFVSICS